MPCIIRGSCVWKGASQPYLFRDKLVYSWCAIFICKENACLIILSNKNVRSTAGSQPCRSAGARAGSWGRASGLRIAPTHMQQTIELALVLLHREGFSCVPGTKCIPAIPAPQAMCVAAGGPEANQCRKSVAFAPTVIADVIHSCCSNQTCNEAQST